MSVKRSIVWVLLLALLLPILAACGGTAGETTTGGETSAAASVGGEASAEASEEGAEASAEASEDATEASAEASEDATEASAAASAGAAESAAASSAGGAGEIDVTQIPVEEGAQLRFAAAGNPTEQQLYQSGADRFNELFADQNVQMTFEPVPSEYETTITAGFSGGNAPDVFLLNGELMGNLAPQGLLLPLDEAMEQAGRDPSDFYEPLLNLYQLDGQTYGLPKDFNPLVIFVNNAMAEQAGVDPASIETWDQLKEAAAAMTQGEGAGKVFGMCLTPDIQRFGASMFQNGNPIIEDGEAVFNQPEGVEALEYWKSYQTDGVGATFQDLGASWCGEAFARQQAAMVMEGGWLVPFMADPAQGGDAVEYTAIPLPIPEGGEQATWLFTNAFGANANTEYPNAAAAAVLFLTSEQNQEALIETGLAQPSLTALADDPYYQENEVAQVLVEASEGGRVADSVLGGPQKKADVLRVLNQAVERIFVGGEAVQAALDQAAQEVNQILQQ